MNSVLEKLRMVASPLLFSTLWEVWGPTAQVVYKRLADLIADKLHKPYNTIIQLIQCRLCFSLLRSTITCLRGSRRPKTNFSGLFTTDPALVVAEGRVPLRQLLLFFLFPLIFLVSLILTCIV